MREVLAPPPLLRRGPTRVAAARRSCCSSHNRQQSRTSPLLHVALVLVVAAMVVMTVAPRATRAADQLESVIEAELRTGGDLEEFERWFWGLIAGAQQLTEIDAPVHLRLLREKEAEDREDAGLPPRLARKGVDGVELPLRDSPRDYAWLPDEVGVFASRDLAEGEILFKVPENLVLQPERVLRASVLGQLLTLDEADPDPDKIYVEGEDVLAVYAIMLRFGDEETSLQPWVDVWPSRMEGPLFWGRGDADMFLEGTGLHQVVVSAVAEEQARFAQLKEALFSHEELKDLDVTFDHWRWAVTLVQSRKVDLVGLSGESFPAMVPMLDMFNHRMTGRVVDAEGKVLEDMTNAAKGDPNRATFGYKASNKFAFVQANQPYRAGEQVFLHYGAYSSRELMEFFGFVLPTTNKNDLVRVPASYLVLDPTDPSYEVLGAFKHALLEEYTKTPEGADELFMTREGVSTELLAASHIVNTAEQDFNTDNTAGKVGPAPAETDPATGEATLSPETQQNVFQWFQSLTADMLKRTSTGPDIRKDYERASSKEAFGELTHTQQIFLQYSITEKEILWHNFNAMAAKERKLLKDHGIDPATAREEAARDEL